MDAAARLDSFTDRADERSRIDSILTAGHKDLITRYRSLAAAIPNKSATTHLVRGEEEGLTLTFAGLDRCARSLAAHFQQRQGRGERALMLFEAGVESIYAFLGCVYAGVIGAPMPAPQVGKVDRYLMRVKSVVVDGGIRFALTTASIWGRVRDVVGSVEGFENIEWIVVDELPDCSLAWVDPQVDEEYLAYMQYTSGSTSDPKGVMVTHRNLMKLIEYNGGVCDYPTLGTQAVCWMPYFHDFGLIDGVLTPLAHGMPVYIISPFDFVQRPMRWIEAVHRYRASHSDGPNFSFELCSRKSTPEERRNLDLSCWVRANNAAEPIRSSTIHRFIETFAPCGFAPEAMAPSWGLAEATLLVTLVDKGAKHYMLDAEALEQDRVEPARDGATVRAVVGCGRVHPGYCEIDLRIVDPDTLTLKPPGQIGEVWVSGDLIAKGYWQRPVETEERFHACIKDLPGKRYLRTGDLGFMAGEELVFTGRRKDLIIVEGRNHYPQAIEETAEKSHPCLRPGCSIAFSIDSDDADVRVVVVCELNKGYELVDRPSAQAAAADRTTIFVSRQEVERAIRRGVAEDHQIRVHDIAFIAPGYIPKTTSGKLQRSGCRVKYLKGTLMQHRVRD